MIKLIRLLFIFYFAFSVSCIIPPNRFPGGQVVLDPKGETILLVTQDQRKIEGEFLFCDQQAVYVLSQQKDSSNPEILECPYADIQRLKVKTYVNKSWVGFVLGGQIVPALLFGLAAGNYYDNMDRAVEYAASLSIFGLVAGLLFLASSPGQPKLEGEITPERLAEIQKYARYPFVPSLEQKKIILEGLKKQ